jgi:hypothetical protein
MVHELKGLVAYGRAVLRYWWVIVIDVVLVLTDFGERIFGTWFLPPLWAKVTLGVAVVVVAQYLVYRELHRTFLELQQSIKTRVDTKWRPSARIEATPPENFLILKSDREFKIENISLLAANNAVVAEIRQRDFETLRSSGYRVSLPPDKVGEWWRNCSGPAQVARVR